jgi:hypothetical protein
MVDDLTKSKSYISITKLELGGCDLLTDNAIQSLKSKFASIINAILTNRNVGLKHLNYLDLSNCKVTDKGLKYLESEFITWLSFQITYNEMYRFK